VNEVQEEYHKKYARLGGTHTLEQVKKEIDDLNKGIKAAIVALCTRYDIQFSNITCTVLDIATHDFPNEKHITIHTAFIV
jgi:hypothetical protein